MKHLGRLNAVDHVSLEVGAGEFLLCTAPLISARHHPRPFAGFEYPEEGHVLIGGEKVIWALPNQRDLGMGFQRYTLFPHMTVLENIVLPLKMRDLGRTKRGERASAVFEPFASAAWEIAACRALQRAAAASRWRTAPPSIPATKWSSLAHPEADINRALKAAETEFQAVRHG
ncbi:ATP-binding cassette domain-containing protein [Roseomonas harenae]|uniref:hypothetical protein n=1 Tax=Muricoccus harenae TaxID=2692566 RepID=UPI0013315023|nr:hypothetical protein [Roseomonas harenae]